MAAYQYVYHMDNVSKTYPGGKKCFENIKLNFLPGVKIGVVGVNGSGKSTLLRIMAGMDTDFQGEAWAAKGVKVGYLAQEPYLDPALDVRGNVMLGLYKKTAILDRYNELAMNYSDETADEMAQLQDQIDAANLWDLELTGRCRDGGPALPARRRQCRNPLRWRASPRRPLPAAAGSARDAALGRTDQPP